MELSCLCIVFHIYLQVRRKKSIARPCTLQTVLANSPGACLRFHMPFKSGVRSIALLSSLCAWPGVGIPERRHANTPHSSLPASLQLSAFHPSLFFPQHSSAFRSLLGTGRCGRERITGPRCTLCPLTEGAFPGANARPALERCTSSV